MDEIAFEGTPLPAEPPLAGGRAVDPPPSAPALRLAAQVQRAHAAVLTAHQAVEDWQVARAVRTGRVPATAPGPAPAPGLAPGPAPGYGFGPAHGSTEPGPAPGYGTAGALAALARAVRSAGAAPAPGRLTVTWHGEAPEDAAALQAVRQDDGWQVRDGTRPVVTVGPYADAVWPRRPVPRFPADPRPLARTSVRRLAAADLAAFAAGDIAAVLGPGFDQGHLPPDALPAKEPFRLLTAVTGIDPRGGGYGQGSLRAVLRLPDDDPGHLWSHLVAAAAEALRAHALHSGLHLCLPGARAVPLTGAPLLVEVVGAAGGELDMDAEITATGMVDRPFLVADCVFHARGRTVARLRDIGITLREGRGADLSVRYGRPSCRRSPGGAPVLAHELHAVHTAEGRPELFVAVPDGGTVTARVRPRLPRGDMRMLDRGMSGEGEWQAYRPGSRGVFEYDVPEDPWYLRECGGSVPALALMEIALQPAGAFSALLGAAGEYPDQDLRCRNLDGRMRLLREVELPGTTVEQHVVLRSHSRLPGGLLHRYDLELRSGGAPLCTAEAAHGLFTPELMALQQGLDGGRYVPSWLEVHGPAGRTVRRMDLRDDERLGRGRLALLEDVVLVPDGGEHGAGYVLCDKPVRPDDWFFDHHFFQDPVMPGSAGVQMLFQAVHALALHTGLVDHLVRPRCAVAVGEELSWSYRGQVLREHERVRGEVHVRRVHRHATGVRLHADGSVWRDALRVYRVRNIAVDLIGREPGGHEAQEVPA
ncbi:3-hydroxyacyl-ACP dehydratase [Streptomyces sp. TRM76323]|uniref:3-hydroxyacyl-ACP dehydratase n=1 Tax=Streptomyces tamarix TaxID=3078565 RepID=A0ABU3QHY6_9ACTN|nr:3-hydroxyacyl-ACP dehydratase [Streptomyces tamarix]MDT9682377.1 3-hydroxyacyl-ACP dehydratase [Streptomyces tamarix]